MAVTSGRHREWLLALAVVLVMLGAVTSRAVAVASSLRKLAAGTVAFSSDGGRFVAWQTPGDQQIEVLDTLTGLRKQITPRMGAGFTTRQKTANPSSAPQPALPA